MLQFYENLSLKNKLILIISITASTLLVLGFALSAFFSIRQMKSSLIKKTKTLAQVTANYSVSDLAFSDKESAYETLSSLQNISELRMATLYDAHGRIFVTFTKLARIMPPQKVDLHYKIIFAGNYLDVYQPIQYKGETYGTLYLSISTEYLRKQIFYYLLTMGLLLLLLIIAAIFLARQLQKIISTPILRLANATQKITAEEDYSVRVKRRSNDELGILYDRFNDMLDQIFKREKLRSEALKALQDSEERYRSVVELSPNAILIHKDGKIIFANPKAVELSGLKTLDEFIGRRISDFIHEDSREHIAQRIKEMQLTRAALDVSEEKFINVKGEIIFGLVAAVHFNIHGESGHLVVIQDITEYKKAEQALLESEERFRQIFEQSNDAMYVIIGTRFVEVNPKFTAILGYTKEDVEQSDFNLLGLVADESLEFIEKRRKAHEAGQFTPDRYIFKGKARDGRILDLEVNLSQVEWKNQVAILGILRDITDQRLLEEQLRQSQKMEAIGTLAGGVAHDFNNLLTVISGHVELAMLKMEDNNPLKRHIDEIEKASKRAQNLTRQLLAFSRKQIVRLKIININEIISDMGKMLGRLISEDITLKMKLADQIAPIKADPGQIEQIIMNLVVNARDAINANTVYARRRIHIETANIFLDEDNELLKNEGRRGLHVLISVTDTGVGMDEETQKKIFEPFFTTKGVGKGTGLGLSTIYGIVKQNNGLIQVISKPEKGTTFKIYWPTSDEEEKSEQLKIKESSLQRGTETIFFVEDDAGIREFAVSALESLGYTIHVAEDAIHALKMVKRNNFRFDLLITDLVMPEVSGKDLVDQLKEKYKELKVLYTSGYTDGNIARDGFLDKDVNFLHKPYSVGQLSQKIRTILDNI